MRPFVPAWLVVWFVAASAAAQVPIVSVSQSNIDVAIGGETTFHIVFDSVGTAPGYGPFIDLVLDSGGADLNGQNLPCDGLEFKSAVVTNTNPQFTIPHVVSAMKAPCSGATTINHPYGASLTVPPGARLVVLPLPFSSFEPAQPEVTVAVTVKVHGYADEGFPLQIAIRGGFRYGTNGPPIVSTSAITQTITPRAMVIRKTIIAPDQETVSGPNFVYSFVITIDVAPGQQIQDLEIQDCGSTAGVHFGSMLSITPLSAVVTPSPPNCFKVEIASISGTNPVVEMKPAFWLSDPPPIDCEFDAGNEVSAAATWKPDDPRDLPEKLVTSAHQITWPRRGIAIQKTAKPLSPAGAVPGSKIEYTLDFQISDYLRFGAITITDTLSDGQKLAGPVRFRVRDTLGAIDANYALIDLPAASFSQATATTSFACPDVQAPISGSTVMTFDISGAMALTMTSASPPAYAFGVLSGGEAMSPGGGPAMGQVVFTVEVQDQYSSPHPGDNGFVDKHDPLLNTAKIDARIVKNQPPMRPQFTQKHCDDTARACLSVPGGTLEKRVIARSGIPISADPLQSLPTFTLGDTITFSVKHTLPTGDGQDIRIDDWYPSPAVMISGPATQLSLPACASSATIPVVNTACYVAPVALPAATWQANLPDNSAHYHLGTLTSITNTPLTIEIRTTLPISSAAMAEALVPTNEARECEKNSFGKEFCQLAIARFRIGEPKLKLWKAILCTAQECPPGKRRAVAGNQQRPPGPICHDQPVCPKFGGGIINSTILPQIMTPSLADLAAHDTFTVAVAVENIGSGALGAYDIELQDIVPASLPATIVPNSLCIRRGDGTPLVVKSGTVNGFDIEIEDPLPDAALPQWHATSGQNIVLITFDMQMNDPATVLAGDCFTNTAELLSFSNAEGGPNFVTAGLAEKAKADALICIRPKSLEKTVIATSEEHTTEIAPHPVAIGEIVTYKLTIDVPEGTADPFFVVDVLPAGFLYLGPAAVASSGGPLNWTGSPTEPSANGNVVTFDFGAITNTQNDAGCETITITFPVLVLNDDTLNTDGATKTNKFVVWSKGGPVGKAEATVVIRRPAILNPIKTSTPATISPGGQLTYSITYTNSGSTTAFDVVLTDPVPAGLDFAGPLMVTSAQDCAGNLAASITSGVLMAGPATLPPNCSVTVTVTANVPPQATCPPLLHNEATIRYTSLPGEQGTNAQTPGASGEWNGELNKTVIAAVDTPCTPVKPDLQVTKVGATAQGRHVHYAITIHNAGPGTAYGVVVNDLPGPGFITCALEPGGEQFMPGITQMNGSAATPVVTPGPVTNYAATIEWIAPGSTVTLHYDGVSWDIQGCTNDCQSLINTVTVTWSGIPNDPNPPYSATATDPLCSHF